MMKFIGYYTEGNYEQVANEHLLPSLKKWDLDNYILKTRNFGDWYQNTGFKPQFILKCLTYFRPETLVMLDVDAEIRSYPELFWQIPEEYDIAVHLLDWYKFWRNQDGNPKRELLSGTMMIRYNERTVKLFETVIEECKKNPKEWEQRVLDRVLKTMPEVKIYDLPIQYCAIIKPDGKVPDYITNPVIIHYQASRQNK